MTASCTMTTSKVRPSRSVRMSPATCSQSEFSSRLNASMSSDRSVSVQRKRRFRKNALWPAPAPSSSKRFSWWRRGPLQRLQVAGRLVLVHGMLSDKQRIAA